MKILVTKKQIDTRVKQRPASYMLELEPAIIEHKPNGDIVFDDEHPAWQAAMAKYRSAHHHNRLFRPGRPTRLTPPNQQPPEPPFAQERRSICDRCPAKPTCPIFQGNSPCRAKNLLKRPGMVCPGDPPKWGPVAE